MPTTELRLRLDDGLLTKARALAERRGASLEDLLIAHLDRWVKKDKRRRLTRAMMKPYVERPTVKLNRIPDGGEDETEG